MPQFSGNAESLSHSVRNRQSLSELDSADDPLCDFVGHAIRIVMKSPHVRARQNDQGVPRTAEVKVGGTTVINAPDITRCDSRPRTFAFVQKTSAMPFALRPSVR